MFFIDEDTGNTGAGGAASSGTSKGGNGKKYLVIVGIITVLILAIGFIF